MSEQRLTKEQRELLCSPHYDNNNKWFYVGRRNRCSFHDGTANQHVHGFTLKSILVALTKTGLLAQWDAKKLRFKP